MDLQLAHFLKDSNLSHSPVGRGNEVMSYEFAAQMLHTASANPTVGTGVLDGPLPLLWTVREAGPYNASK